MHRCELAINTYMLTQDPADRSDDIIRELRKIPLDEKFDAAMDTAAKKGDQKGQERGSR